MADRVHQVGIEYRKVGKKAAGRRLHGIEHNGLPKVFFAKPQANCGEVA